MVKRVLSFWIVGVLLSCSDNDEISSGLSNYDESVIEYFNEVALGFEFGGGSEITRKWKNEMRIFVGGDKRPSLMNELNSIISEVTMLATDGFTMRIVADSSEMNYYVFFGSAKDYAKIYPSQAGLVTDNWGLFNIFWDSSDQLYSGNMYVDIDRANDTEAKHLLREELTQSLGLAKDSWRYPESIFQAQWTTTNTYADIDKDLIRLLYHSQMRVGLNAGQVNALLTEILLSEK